MSTGRVSVKQLLDTKLWALKAGKKKSSASQQDPPQPYHPSSVKHDATFKDRVNAFISGLSPGPSDAVQPLQESANTFSCRESAVAFTWSSYVSEALNRIMAYEGREERWSPDTNERPSDSREEAIAQLHDQVQQHVTQRQYLDVAFKPMGGAERPIKGVVELKSEARLQSDTDSTSHPGRADAVPIAGIWNEEVSVSNALHGNVVGVICQVTRYCYRRGIARGGFSNYMYTYFINFDQTGNMLVSDGIAYDSAKPTLLECMYYLSRQCLEQELLSKWAPATSVRAAAGAAQQPAAGGSGTGATAGGSDAGAAAGQRHARNDSAASSSISKRQKVSRASTAQQSDVLPATDQAAQAAPAFAATWQVADPSTAADLAVELAAAAARFEPQHIIASSATGACGLVFLARTTLGAAAVKIVSTMAPEARQLQREADNYRKLRTLFGGVLTSSVAAGECLGGQAFMVATQHIAGRHVAKGDADLAREALRTLHQHNVLHGDLHPHNMLVEEATSRLVLLDLATAKQGASQAELHQEVIALERMLARL